MSTLDSLGFTHVHVAPAAGSSDSRTILLLHGTGGNERDLLDIGATIAPGARLLGVRGQVLEGGMPRFFRRMAEGVFDEADIIRRSADLAVFVSDAASEYGFDATQVIALGFSNGANIAAAMMLLNPDVLAGGMLIRAMVPLVPAATPSLAGAQVIMIEGTMDPLIPRANAEQLAAMLRDAGAAVTVHWEPSGHGLTPTDVAVARSWYAALE